MNPKALPWQLKVLLLGAASSIMLLAQKGATDILADQADAVVVGEIISGQQSGRLLGLTLSVTRTLKGVPAPGDKLQVSAGPVALSFSGPVGAHYGLWFLKKMATQWVLLPLIQHGATLESSGYLPLPQVDPSKIVSNIAIPVTMNDRIAIEIVAAIRNHSDPKQISAMARNLVGISQSTVLPALYQSLRLNPDPDIRFVGLIGMLDGRDENEVSALVEITNDLAVIPRIRTYSQLTIAISGVRTPHSGAIQPLGKLAASSDIGLQRAAASALANIHSREAVPYLAQLLNSQDSRVRNSAIWGLNRFVENLPIQTANNVNKHHTPQGPTPFRTADTDKHSPARHQISLANEAEFVAFWKSWWVAMKDKIAKGGQ